MPSNTSLNILAGMRAVTAWQQQIVKNAQGYLMPGYNTEQTVFGSTGGTSLSQGEVGTPTQGSRNPTSGGSDTLEIAGTQIEFQQGQLDPADSPTSLGIQGGGFFILAQNLQSGTKLFLTRNGDFHYDASGRLVNAQGLFVVGGSGTLTNPPTPVMNPGDGTVNLSNLTLGIVPSPNGLVNSGYGSTTYALTPASGAIQAFPDGAAQVGFTQANTLEQVPRGGIVAELDVQTTDAANTYKMFKNLMDSYNTMMDDANQLVK